MNAAGEQVEFSYLVTNMGTLTMSNISVAQQGISTVTLDSIVCADQTLAPGLATTCSGGYEISSADMGQHTLVSSVSAIGSSAEGQVESNINSSAVITVAGTGAIEVTPVTTSIDGGPMAGDQVTISYFVENIGSLGISALEIEMIDSSGTGTIVSDFCNDTIIVPGDDPTVCQLVYTLTQEDIDAGEILPTVQVSGTSKDGQVDSSPVVNLISIEQNPSVEVTIASAVDSVDYAGQTIIYTFVVANTGNTTITGLDVELAGLELDCFTSTIPVEGSVICTGEHVVTQEDMDTGNIDPAITVTSAPPSSGTATEVVIIPNHINVNQIIGLSSVQSVSPHGPLALVEGTQLIYQIIATNTGNTTLRNVHPVVGTFTGSGSIGDWNCLESGDSLAPLGTITCTAEYSVTADDVANRGLDFSSSTVASDVNGDKPKEVSTGDVNILGASLPIDERSVNVDENQARGAGIPGARVEVSDGQGNLYCAATVGDDGKWSCNFAGDNRPVEGDTVAIIQIEPGRVPSLSIEVVVSNEVTPTPTPTTMPTSVPTSAPTATEISWSHLPAQSPLVATGANQIILVVLLALGLGVAGVGAKYSSSRRKG